jgi:hypothetical protein
MRASRPRLLWLLVILTATAIHLHVPAVAVSVAEAPLAMDARRLQGKTPTFGRKLLQPYVLNKTNGDDLVPQSLFGRINERRVNDATRNVVAPEIAAITLLDRE